MIKLSDIWSIENLTDFKIHFARRNKHGVEPLDAFARSRDEWQEWQEYRPTKDEFNRDFIFSLAQFYRETDSWLFGGIFRVTGRPPNRYEVELTDQGASFIGRLKLSSPYRSRAPRVNMEGRYGRFKVLEIRHESYGGRPFPGYEKIDVPFHELETLVNNSRPDWQAALESVKGVYLITVHSRTVRQYVGAAYGDQGIWSRWANYAEDGHGGNVELRRIVEERGRVYCRQHFRFALLEPMPRNASDEAVQERESFWKGILGTGGPGGLNRN